MNIARQQETAYLVRRPTPGAQAHLVSTSLEKSTKNKICFLNIKLSKSEFGVNFAHLSVTAPGKQIC